MSTSVRIRARGAPSSAGEASGFDQTWSVKTGIETSFRSSESIAPRGPGPGPTLAPGTPNQPRLSGADTVAGCAACSPWSRR